MDVTRSCIYLDHAATTPLDPAVFEVMRPFLWSAAGNPSSPHASGRCAREAVETSREQVANVLGCEAGEVIFTSGGTESDNLALIGVAEADVRLRRHIITTAIEHHAVLFAARALAARGFDVTELPVDSSGRVSGSELKASLRSDTLLVSIGLANNEIGTVQDFPELARIVHRAGALIHTDAVQAAAQMDINVDRLEVDLLSLAAHKFYGPKGVGVLYVRDGVALERYAHGGMQERGRRSGTENVAGIVGLATALTRANEMQESRVEHYQTLSTKLEACVTSGYPQARLLGDGEWRLPTFATLAFPSIDAESLLIRLDLDGIEVSSGAACATGSLEPSHVVEAIGLPSAYRNGVLRCTVGLGNTLDDIKKAGSDIVRHARALEMVAARAPRTR